MQARRGIHTRYPAGFFNTAPKETITTSNNTPDRGQKTKKRDDMKKQLRKEKNNLFYFAGREKRDGQNPKMSGDCTGLIGDCTGLIGDCTGLSGDIDQCEITEEDREKTIEIYNLVGE